MAIAEQDLVNTGQRANDGKGDTARVAFDKVNKLLIQLDSNIENGAIGYLDYASMMLDNSKPDGTIAQLTTGDRYIRLSGEWVKTFDKVDAQANMLNADIAKVAQSVVDKNIYAGETSLAHAWTDEKDRIAIGITERGDFYQPSAEERNTNHPGWAVTDSQDRILVGVNTALSEGFLMGKQVLFSHEHSNAEVDQNYKLSEMTASDGSKYIPGGVVTDVGICYLKDGDVYLQRGAENIQVTNRGDVVACEMSGSSVRYVAPRRGVMLTYQWANGETKQVLQDSLSDGYIITGQSLAEGGANSAINTDITQNAYTIETGPIPNQNRAVGTRLVELKEQIFETISSGFAKVDTAKTGKPIVIFGAAYGGQVYDKIRKGGSTGIYEKIITSAKAVSNFPHKPSYKAIFVIHGEGDGNTSNTVYDENLKQWLTDFTQDLQSINGQAEKPVMLLCQTSSVSGYRRTADIRHTFTTPFLQLKVTAESPYHYLVCPKYQFNYKDYAHILAKDTQYLGEYYAKVKNEVIDKGNEWLGLRPKRLTKVNARTVDIEFSVPIPPLVLDTDLVSNPGNYGFTIYNGGSATISSVSLVGADKVRIVANQDIPSDATITYAFDNGTGGKSGRLQGARGNLRDSDPTMTTDGQFNLYNWAFAFELPIK